VKPFLICVVAFAVSACGGSTASCPTTASFSASPQLALASSSGALSLAVRTSPEPLARGMNEVQYQVSNTNGEGVSGLSLAVVPWMPDMGHGSSVLPVVTDEGQGTYLVTCVDIIMPGAWQLRTTFTGPVSDSATPTFQVE
jgi:hypothetical protein